MKIIPLELDATLPEPLELQNFVDFPWDLYDKNPAWIPPSKAMVLSELNPKKNLFFTHGRAKIFLCKEENQVIGRILASVDTLLAEGPQVGYFGYFECVHDSNVALSLFRAAEEWLKSQGCTEVRGPVNFTIFNSYRIQIAGFETQPFLGEPRSPSYYQALLEENGYSVHAKWNSWDLDSNSMKILEETAIEFVRPFQNTLGDYRLEPFNSQEAVQDCGKLYPVVLETFKRNFGFTAISFDEYLQNYMAMAPFIDTSSFKVMDRNSNLVGFTLIYPDLSKPDQVILFAIGISEKHRKAGVAQLCLAETLRNLNSRFPQAIGAIAKEGRTFYDKVGSPSRTYAVFSKKLESGETKC
jgi:hypothetical protein